MNATTLGEDERSNGGFECVVPIYRGPRVRIRLEGTESSNPACSSRESVSRPTLPCGFKKPPFSAGLRAGACGEGRTARETRALAREIGLVPCTTPIESPQFQWHCGGLRKDLQTRLRPPSQPSSIATNDDPGGLLLWDNCTVQHRAVQDYDLPQRRLIHRTTMGGVVPL
jgi:hypothetical protein